MGQAMSGQDPGLVHDTSQLHDAAQSISGHASAPEHSIVHSCTPQLRLPHAIEPEQSTSQLCACAQSTAPHAPPLLHRILQSYPAGHCTSPHGLPGVHSIRQLWSLSHVVHGLGHPAPVPVSTQNPWTQDRPLSQSRPLPAGSQA
jgi:hypothetical protein